MSRHCDLSGREPGDQPPPSPPSYSPVSCWLLSWAEPCWQHEDSPCDSASGGQRRQRKRSRALGCSTFCLVPGPPETGNCWGTVLSDAPQIWHAVGDWKAVMRAPGEVWRRMGDDPWVPPRREMTASSSSRAVLRQPLLCAVSPLTSGSSCLSLETLRARKLDSVCSVGSPAH